MPRAAPPPHLAKKERGILVILGATKILVVKCPQKRSPEPSRDPPMAFQGPRLIFVNLNFDFTPSKTLQDVLFYLSLRPRWVGCRCWPANRLTTFAVCRHRHTLVPREHQCSRYNRRYAHSPNGIYGISRAQPAVAVRPTMAAASQSVSLSRVNRSLLSDRDFEQFCLTARSRGNRAQIIASARGVDRCDAPSN